MPSVEPVTTVMWPLFNVRRSRGKKRSNSSNNTCNNRKKQSDISNVQNSFNVNLYKYETMRRERLVSNTVLITRWKVRYFSDILAYKWLLNA